MYKNDLMGFGLKQEDTEDGKNQHDQIKAEVADPSLPG